MVLLSKEIKEESDKNFFKFIEDNPDKPWNWNGISYNPNITMEIIKANPDKPWDWIGISYNPNITMEFVEDNPDKPWDWSGISYNPNITMEFIKANPDKPWNWNGISQNSFEKERELIKEHMAATKIQRSFKKYRYDPKYPFCKRVLINNLEECGVKF